MKFFEYSESKHYTISPDILEYDRLERPVFDLILGVKTMKKLGIVLDAQTSQMRAPWSEEQFHYHSDRPLHKSTSQNSGPT